jgi:hypothetical protein
MNLQECVGSVSVRDKKSLKYGAGENALFPKRIEAGPVDVASIGDPRNWASELPPEPAHGGPDPASIVLGNNALPSVPFLPYFLSGTFV